MKKRLLLITAIACFLICLLPGYALAQDRYWIGDTDSWFDDSNWDPYGIPTGFTGPVFLTSSDEIDRTVYYDTDAGTVTDLLIDATGTGSMTLIVSSGILVGGRNLSIGTGKLVIEGGGIGGATTVSAGGTVELYGGGFVGMGGHGLGLYGTVNQSGGISQWDGVYVGPTGRYNISGGSLQGFLTISGVLNQSGGEIPSHSLTLRGTYNLSGGMHSAGYTFIESTGIFNQTGGNNHVGLASFDLGNSGTYNLSGGTLEADDPFGFSNHGTFNYSGGNLSLSGDIGFITWDYSIFLEPELVSLKETWSITASGRPPIPPLFITEPLRTMVPILAILLISTSQTLFVTRVVI